MLEATTLIVRAIVAGMTGDLDSNTRSLYDRLLAKLEPMLGDSEDAQLALTAVRKNPQSRPRQAFLKEELERLGLGEDKELVELSQSVLDGLEHVSTGVVKGGYYDIAVSSGSVVIGDAAKVEQSIGKWGGVEGVKIKDADIEGAEIED